MESFSYLFPFTMNIARYFLFAGLAFVIFYKVCTVFFESSKIQAKNAQRKDFFREIIFSMQTTIILAAVTIVIVYSPLREYTQLYTEITEYSVWWIPLSIVAALVLHDTYFYWMHRFVHHRKVFNYLHITHHKSTNPSPWTSYAFGFSEGILESLIAPLILFMIPMHPLSLIIFTMLAFAINVYGHLGYEIMPKWFRKSVLFRFINTSVHHNLHHEKFNGNYGLYFRFWDRIMKTENPNYEKQYDKIQLNRFPTGKGSVGNHSEDKTEQLKLVKS